jgi:hypothetical protein
MMRLTPLFALFLVAGAVGSTDAFARPTKIALTKIDGDASVGKAVVAALDDTDLDIVSARQVNFTLGKLGLDGKLGDGDLERLATALEVDAIVRGVFDRRERKMRFKIFANGKLGQPFSVEVGNAQSARFRTLVRTTVVAQLSAVVPLDIAPGGEPAVPSKAVAVVPASAPKGADKPTKARPGGKPGDAAVAEGPVTSPSGKPVKPASGEGPVTSPARPAGKVAVANEPPKPVEPAKPAAAPNSAADGAARPAKVAEAPVAADPPKLAKAKDAGDGGAVFAAAKEYQPESGAATQRVASAARDDRDDATPSVRARFEPAPAPSGHSANLVAVRADLGMSVMQRNLVFQATAGSNAPKNYVTDPVPGVRFAGAIYPFAFSDPHSWLAGFGVAGEVDQTVPLTLASAAEPTVALNATERHFSVGLRYRIAFGSTPTSPTLTVGAGYAAQSFQVDRSGLMSQSSFDVPNVDYRMVDPGLAFRLPLGRRFAITLEGRGFIVLDSGELQNADQYGTTKLYGGTGSAGLELVLANRFALRVAAEVTSMNLAFDGNGALSNNRDGNPATIDVSRAIDSYFGGSATLAVMY